ncbi:hypothetical protein GCM10009819_07470 [Agromyces tropicus]|uniref:Periplasmic binding protein domain-containing protein n=1 Tax=Agromyces tropicus TaxID=555371 RepID=A0ABP5FJK1_9MICO
MKTQHHKVVTGALGILALLALSACSGQGTSDSGGGDAAGGDTSAAEEVVAEATAEITGGAIPESSPAIAEDKLVIGIPCAYAAEGCKRGVDAVEEAAGELGWEYQMIDPAGDPEQMREAVRTAIQLGADGIFLGALPSAVVADEVADARSAGIKVVNMYEPAPDDFADANSMSDHYQAGYWNAAYVAVATEGAGKIITVNDPEFPSVTTWYEGFTDGLAELCPGCTVVRELTFQIANLQSQVPVDFQAALTANPDTDAVWTAYDPVYAAIQPVIERSDNADLIVVSHNGDPFAVDDIESGDKPLKASVAYSIEWQSYAAVDQMNRLFADELEGEQADFVVPQKQLTIDNITSNPFDGDYDWKADYLAIWDSAS